MRVFLLVINLQPPSRHFSHFITKFTITMFILILFILFLQLQGLTGQALDANGISLDEKVLAVERLFLSGGTIIFPVTPCYFILGGPPSPDATTIMGDQTSAQWVRTVFHDFITANATAGTG
jgi:hypothetical protein